MCGLVDSFTSPEGKGTIIGTQNYHLCAFDTMFNDYMKIILSKNSHAAIDLHLT